MSEKCEVTGIPSNICPCIRCSKPVLGIKRFTAYRRNLAERGTHNADQMNAENEPQYEGVVFSDGTVVIRWLTACRSTSVWANLDEMLRIHGHPEYGTEIIWHDHTDIPPEWKRMCDALVK